MEANELLLGFLFFYHFDKKLFFLFPCNHNDALEGNLDNPSLYSPFMFHLFHFLLQHFLFYTFQYLPLVQLEYPVLLVELFLLLLVKAGNLGEELSTVLGIFTIHLFFCAIQTHVFNVLLPEIRSIGLSLQIFLKDSYVHNDEILCNKREPYPRTCSQDPRCTSIFFFKRSLPHSTLTWSMPC